MPTPSSHYSDLEYATVNQDGDTWGGITNNYINGLLTKLRDLENRVIIAEGQLTTINASVDPVNKMNTTLASALQGKDVLSGATTTLSPDPYSGNYTTATAWPAYGSAELASISVPTSLSAVQGFSYENFANALSPILTAVETKVTQATADVSTARIDICKTKKLLDAFNAGGTYFAQYQGSSIFGLLNYTQQRVSDSEMRYLPNSSATKFSASGSSTGTTTGSGFTEPLSIGASAQYLMPQGLGSHLSSLHSQEGTQFDMLESSVLESSQQNSDKPLYATYKREADNTYLLTLNYSPSTASAGFQTGVIYNGFNVLTYKTATAYQSPDLTPCDSNPGGPHFIT